MYATSGILTNLPNWSAAEKLPDGRIKSSLLINNHLEWELSYTEFLVFFSKCTMGQWNCKELPCPGRCSLEGGSFVTTFDSRSYRFHGVCTYILMKVISWNLEPQKYQMDIYLSSVSLRTQAEVFQWQTFISQIIFILTDIPLHYFPPEF